MQSCEDICLLCEKKQSYKINKTFWHGVCEDHKNLDGNAIRCQTCSTIIEKFMYIEVYECQSCFMLSKIKGIPCGHQVCKDCSGPCKVCENVSFAVSEYRMSESRIISKSPQIFSFDENNEQNSPSSPTFRTIESEHINNNPIIDLPDENPNYPQIRLESPGNGLINIEDYEVIPAIPDKPCDSCINMNEGTHLVCNHFICKECFNGECPICAMVEPIMPNSSYSNMSPDKIQASNILENNKKWCAYCTQNLAKIVLPCSHSLCEKCFKEPCQMCLLLTLKSSDGNQTIIYQEPLKCISCSNAENAYMLHCGHALCKNCDKGSCPECLLNNSRRRIEPGSGIVNQTTLHFSINSSRSSELITDPPGTDNKLLNFKDSGGVRTISSVERSPSSFNRTDEIILSKESTKVKPIIKPDKGNSIIRPESVRNTCEYCLVNEIDKKYLVCMHNICNACYQNGCPLCDLLERNTIYEHSGSIEDIISGPPIRKISKSLHESMKNPEGTNNYSNSSLLKELEYHSSASSFKKSEILLPNNPVALVQRNGKRGKRNEGEKMCCEIA